MKRKTNIDFVKDLMNFSNHGMLMQAFVIEALIAYSKETVASPKWASETFISQEAWKGCAQEVLDDYAEHTKKN